MNWFDYVRAGRSDTDWPSDWMDDGQADAAAKPGGRTVARFRWRAKAVAVVAAVGFAAAAVTASAATEPNRWPAVPFALFAVAVAAWAGARVCRLEWDRTTTYARTLGRGRRAIPWSAVDAAKYSTWRSTYMVDAGPFGHVLVSDFIGGSAVLVQFARAQLRDRRTRRPLG